ncbi:MAG: HAD family hydrolase [Agarilytica sp.]
MHTKVLSDIPDQVLPKKDIKVAFFDIDGTLLGLDGNYAKTVAQEITRIQAQGIKTAIASGRPSFAATFIAEELSLQDPGLFCTGAHLYHPREHTSLQMFGMDTALCQALTEYLRRSEIYYEVYTEASYFVESNRSENIRHTHTEHMRVAPQNTPFEQVIENSRVVKFLVAVDNKEAHHTLCEMENTFPECHFAYASIAKYPDWQFASIIDKSACKHNAFDALLKYYDVVADNVISFGDAQSDVVFLQRSGLGVAMGNAKPEVKAQSDYVTKPVWEDGVAYALSRLIPKL